ncbi:MAG TPA: non-homologous end-joining DNA ligase [Nitrososphaeraceae archaeon]|nr:non-homologous end-joining DNA ligase [Nitrososphaeraceae archaeon]
MLATLIDKPFDNKEWVFEVKWDGVRAILFLHKTKGISKIVSRNGKTITHRYPEIIEAVKSSSAIIINCKESIILDGEIVVLNKEGRPDFQSHQRRMNVDSIKDIEKLSHKMPATYYLFDILYIDGRNLQSLSFLERRKNLSDVIVQTMKNNNNNRIRISDFVDERGIDIFQRIKSMDLEGIIAKNKYSKYIQGARSTNWLKIKDIKSQDCVVIGYTRGEGNRQRYFGSLILAIYDIQEKELRFAGHTGSGFDFGQLNEIYSKFQQMKIERCPAKYISYTNREPVWIRPELVAEIKFSGWTKEKIMRSPIFLRFRDDKRPEECIMEKESNTEQVIVSQQRHHQSSITNTTTTSLVTTRATMPPTNNIDFKRSRINFLSNLDKVYWPKTSEHPELTKADLIEYYNRVSDYILYYLKDRPLSLSRYPEGITGKHFFHKNWGDKEKPEFVNTVQVYSKSTGNINDHLVCNNKDALLWIANLGCIEMHPWHSRIKDYTACKDIAEGYSSSYSPPAAVNILNEEKCGLNYPDFIVFDLDPYIYSGEEKEEGEPAYNINSFKAAVEVAYNLKDLLDMLTINSYVKTSGKTGLHIFVPINNRYSFDQTRRFAETIGKMLVRRYPQKVTMEWDTDKRKGKVFFDHNQNSIGKTIASVFSVRPTISATVSMPIKWEELQSILPTDFTILNAFEEIKKSEDAWKHILEKKQDLEKIFGK